jgi:tetratricopeptide (TPR) repeat protein
MPSREAYDGGHTAFTDHQILAKPRPAGSVEKPVARLAPWRQPNPALVERNLGLAHISVGERDQSAEHLNEGFRRLSTLPARFSADPAVLTSLGAVLQRKGVPREAARYFRRASELEPLDARHRLNLAVALRDAGEPASAILSIEAAISMDPSLLDAYLLLAEIHRGNGDNAMARTALKRYLEFMPQSIRIRKRLRNQ